MYNIRVRLKLTVDMFTSTCTNFSCGYCCENTYNITTDVLYILNALYTLKKHMSKLIIGSANWTPRWLYLLTAVQLHTTTLHCMFYREQLHPAHPKADPGH